MVVCAGDYKDEKREQNEQVHALSLHEALLYQLSNFLIDLPYVHVVVEIAVHIVVVVVVVVVVVGEVVATVAVDEVITFEALSRMEMRARAEERRVFIKESFDLVAESSDFV